ncbi:hypothetical protein Tco_0261364 [Tanacetum coccineum]
MLEKGNYIPWESRFRRFLDNKLEDGERIWNLIQNGPYQRPIVVDPIHPTVSMLEPLSKMTKGNKKQYIVDVRVMNYLLQSILNDIYNSVDASKEGESLDSVHERLTTLVNIMDLQFEPHVLASRAKKAAKNQDPLALIAHSNASSLHSHTKYSYSLQSYYVTHPPSVVDYDDKYQGEMVESTYKLRMQVMVEMQTRMQGETEIEGLMQEMKDIMLMNNINQKVRDSKYFREQMLLAMKDEARSNLSHEENDFMLDTSYGEELEELTVHALSKVHEQVSHGKRKTIIQTMDDNQIDSNIIFDDPFVENNAENQKRLNNELKRKKGLLQRELEKFKDWVKTFESTTIQYSTYKETCDELERKLRNDKDTIDKLVKEKEQIQTDFLKVENEKIIIQHETKLEKKAFKEQENRYLDDILDLEEKLSSHDRIVYKMDQSIQMIHMLGKKPNKVYDPFLKARLGYTNPERLKKTIAAQPKMYDGDLIHSNKLVIHSIDSEETLEDAKESRNKMRHKMVQIDYEKLNALYDTFVPQQEPSAEQTYFSIPSTSDNGSTSKDVPSKSPEQQKHELLKVKLEKSASDSRDIQANLLKRIKILENDFQRSQAQSIEFELELQHQKEKMACDVSWKAKLSTLHDENLLLKQQVKSTVQERENIKLEFQKLFNSIKATRAQHQNEINEMFEDVTQKTYAYADVHAQNQDLLMTISELKSKLQTIDKGKHVDSKFDKSETLGHFFVSKTVNVVNDGLNIMCISCGLDVFLHSYEKCVARNALTRKSSVKRALFTSLVAATSKSLGATSIVAKSRFSVAKTPTETNKVSNVSSLSQKYSQSDPACTVDLLFRNDHFTPIAGYGDYVQGNLTICHVYYVEGLGHNLFSVGQFCDGDLEDDAPPIVVSSEEQVVTEPNSPVLNEVADEFVQEDVAHQSPQGIFICQSQYTMDILKKHRIENCDTVSTPMATTKLDADLQGNPVDQTKYRSMIGGLMYLTARRPNIAFATFHVEKGTIELYFVRTEYQLADLFTKALPKEMFEFLVYKIGTRCMTPTQLERLAKLSS